MTCSFLLGILVLKCLSTYCFNMDTSFPIIYEDPLKEFSRRNSYFGYSTIIQNGSNPWIQVAAPRSNSSKHMNVIEPGVVVRCPILGKCVELLLDSTGNDESDFPEGNSFWDHKNNAWIGVSMDVQSPLHGGRVVICGHRWKNQIEVKEDKGELYVCGVCYWMDANSSANTEAMKLLPLLGTYYKNINGINMFYHGMGQAGTSVHFPRFHKKEHHSELLIGAPGVRNWIGTAIKYEDDVPFSSPKEKRSVQPNAFSILKMADPELFTKKGAKFSYVGYQVTSGRFFDKNKLLYVLSAPRFKLKGAIFVLDYNENPHIITQQEGEKTGDYFGASMSVGDINGDGYDDLVIGAPHFSADKGRVYIYSKRKVTFRLLCIIDGSSRNGQFGLAVSSLGDIDRDNFGDIAVGAPYENNGHGALYIYNGRSGGVKLSQEIKAEKIFSELRGFGISISNPADIDENSVNDVAVGSYLSGHAVLFRGSPVIALIPEIYSQTDMIPRTQKNFKFHPRIRCVGCSEENMFSVNITIDVDSENKQAFLNKEMTIHKNSSLFTFKGEYTEHGEFDYVDVYIKEDPDTSKNIKLAISIEIGSKSGNNIFIRGDKVHGQDGFCKHCPVVDRLNTQLNESKTVVFVNECGDDAKCESDVQLNCQFKKLRFNEDAYIIGSGDPLLLEVIATNLLEPAYHFTIEVMSPKPIETANIPQFCYHTPSFTILCDNKPLYNDKPVNRTFEFEVKNLERYACTNESISFLQFVVVANTSSNNVRKDIQCTPTIALKRQANLKIAGLSKPDNIPLQNHENETVTHFYKVTKEGPSPVKETYAEVHVPTTMVTDEGERIKFLLAYTVKTQWTKNDVTCSYQSENQIKFGLIDEQIKFKKTRRSVGHLSEEAAYNNNIATLSGNRTLYLNCTSPGIECQKITCFSYEMCEHNSNFDLVVDFVLNASALELLLGIKTVALFSTTAVTEITKPKDMESDSGILSTNVISTQITADVNSRGVPVWIIIVAIIVGILLLVGLIVGLIKLGFFRREKRDLMKANLTKEEDADCVSQDATG